ncbi:MAG: hypothetical protein ACX930_11120 [Erythrobacter sp.]
MKDTLPFLHRLDSLTDEAELVMTSHMRLREAIFLDGRERFWTERMLLAKDEIGLAIEPQATAFIFHIGFCGSTLLARLLDAPGDRFVLKEPQALSDLASQLPLSEGAKANLDIAVGALAGSAPDGEVPIVKPSCWVNPLLSRLVERGLIERAVFLNLDWRAYLTACFRGGRDRLAYCARFADLFARYDTQMRLELDQAIVANDDALDRMARIVLLLHAWQTSEFAAAEKVLGDGRALSTTFPAANAEPAAQAIDLARFLCPGSGAGPLDQSVDLKQHAKDSSQAFDTERQDTANAEIERHHGARFDAARAWIESAFPSRSVTQPASD